MPSAFDELDAEVTDRVEGTAGAVAWLAGNGAHVVRVHDVQVIMKIVRVADGIVRWRA
jgi:dihydropteroate synthase